jgi:hypothetical protein
MMGMNFKELQSSQGSPSLRIQTVFLYAEFLVLALAGVAAAGFGRFSPLPAPPLGRTAVVILLAMSMGFAALVILGAPGVRAHQLSEVAGREDQVGVRQRAYAVGGFLVGVGGLGGLIVADVLTYSLRQVLVAGLAGVILALVGAYGRLVGGRRALARDAVVFLRRAARAGSASFEDQELGRLEVLLSATWVPGSRTSWMTAQAAESFCEQLTMPEKQRDPAFADCLERVLRWVESGSGLVGAGHADTGLTKGFLDVVLRLAMMGSFRERHLPWGRREHSGIDDAGRERDKDV